MESKAKTQSPLQEKETQAAQVDIWKYVFAFTPMAVLKCAIELQISETVESHGGSITLPELSVALHCSSSALHRIMRYLIYHGFFKQTRIIRDDESSLCYTQTPHSRLLLKDGMAGLILLESSPVMLAPWHGLSGRAMLKGSYPFEAAHGGVDVWKYAAANPDHSKLINDAMACHARLAVSAIVDRYPEAFEGISSLVDVGGGDGTALNALVKACPWIRGVNYDLPHVISVAPHREGVEHVGGDMFKMVPKGDAAFLMWVLHDWSDEECIQILRNCMEAIPRDKGKVIIVEAVVEVGEGFDDYSEVRLALDMVMMAHTEKGKERTWEEWGCLLNEAGFTKYTEKRIEDVVSVIEAYP
ncbi:flavonoid 4'-O-methyltransferase 3-like isoform X1 [Primulina tabacum]|uniref:flavonoid 4'-O-methyltransferase 3-like isoform X1 n=1 Tax=Primulina tabacum TaxID=48773 RepID=UPI003F5A9E31